MVSGGDEQRASATRDLERRRSRSSSGLVGNLKRVAYRLTQRQSLALIEELDTATKLIDFGLANLREQATEGFHHLPQQLLAQGLERFLKLTYALAALRTSGQLPSIRKVRGFGHDLERLADEVVTLVAPRHRVKADLEFIRSDSDLRSLLKLLSDFGQESRYHHLNALLAPSSVQADNDPSRRWSEFESAFAERQPDWAERMGSLEDIDDALREVAASIAALIDRFARAIARMWTQGALPEEAGQYSPMVFKYLLLRDEGLGLPRG